jgi:hypothetical protein
MNLLQRGIYETFDETWNPERVFQTLSGGDICRSTTKFTSNEVFALKNQADQLAVRVGILEAPPKISHLSSISMAVAYLKQGGSLGYFADSYGYKLDATTMAADSGIKHFLIP